MDRDLGTFPPDLEPLVRRLIARDCKLPEAEHATSRLRGREVTFYKNVWLGQIELADGDRYYFLTRPRGRKGRLVPISNAIGAVDRAIRQYALNLHEKQRCRLSELLLRIHAQGRQDSFACAWRRRHIAVRGAS